jgi:uncharacterized protein (TIGR00255 family)
MIQSMTAFARSQSQNPAGNIICELRSINHRYLEFNVRMPDALSELETAIRERVRQHINRGKVDCYLRYQPSSEGSTDITVNLALAKKLCVANESIAQLLKNPAPINSRDILQWPGILEIEKVNHEAIQKDVLDLLENCLQDLVAARNREGEQLKQLFLQRLDGMQQEVAGVRKRLPAILDGQREKLLTRFREARLQLDANRLEQELVLYAQKIDVSEELERLDTHLVEIHRLLEQGGAMGRRLDFLMQELNREANTLGSKSVDSETTRASVELKVLIEQMREQVQNIE